MEAWCIGSVCSGATRAAERGGMCCPHYVDRPLPQPGNWLPGSAPVSQGFTSPISNNYFVRVCNSSRERWRVLRFIISSRVVHSSCCYASCFFFFVSFALLARNTWIRFREAVWRLGETTVLVMFFLLLLVLLLLLLLFPVFSSSLLAVFGRRLLWCAQAFQ